MVLDVSVVLEAVVLDVSVVHATGRLPAARKRLLRSRCHRSLACLAKRARAAVAADSIRSVVGCVVRCVGVEMEIPLHGGIRERSSANWLRMTDDGVGDDYDDD